METVITFLDKHRRAFGVGIIFLILVIMFGVSNIKTEDPSSGVHEEFEDQTKNEELSSLLKNYYKAYASGDVEALEKLAYPLSDKEKSYIKLISNYVKSYDIEGIYTKYGADKNSLLLSAKVGIHYRKLSTVAPGLDFFYVQKNKKGKYYINNLYSTFNSQNGELDVDPTITALIATYEQQDDVVALQSEVSTSFNEIALKNKDFNVYFTKTLPEVVTEWAADYKKKAEKTAKKDKKKNKEDKKKGQETAKADQKADDKNEKEEEKSKKNTKSEKSDKSKKSDENTKSKKSDKSENSKKSDKTTKADKKNASAKSKEKTEKTNNSASAAEKTVEVYAKETVNIRKKPSTSANVVAHADKGTRLLRYQEKKGWSQIRYNGKKLWIKSSYLTTKNPKKTGSSVKEGKIFRMSTSVNIRKKKNTKSAIVAAVHEGDLLTIVKKYDDGWTKVRFEDEVGFMKTDLIK